MTKVNEIDVSQAFWFSKVSVSGCIERGEMIKELYFLGFQNVVVGHING